MIKLGGSTLGSGDTAIQDVVDLQKSGYFPVIVHGGGKIINQWIQRTNAEPKFLNGLRVTDSDTLEVVTAVLTGLVNKQLVGSIAALGGRVFGMSGVDARLLNARVMDDNLGLVGEITSVDSEFVVRFASDGWMPVIAPIALALDAAGSPTGGMLNINGDSAAAALAIALRADQLIFMTDVPGVLDESKGLIRELTSKQAQNLIDRGIAEGGMLPKIRAAIEAANHVKSTHIVDGREPGALLNCVNGIEIGTKLG